MANNGVKDALVGDLIASGTLVINDGYRVRNRELGPSGIPFVRGGDIGDGWVSTEVQDHILPEFADRVTGKLVQPDDVAFITKGTVGRVGRVRLGQPSFVFAPQVCYWRVVDRNAIDPGYLFYLLTSEIFQKNLDAVKTHGSMVADYVSMSDQRRFRLPIPPIVRQRQISTILGALDDKIELNRRTNETLESMARALFKSWFIDFDPVLGKAAGLKPVGLDAATAAVFPAAFEQSPLAEVPQCWKIGTVGEVAALLKETINPSDSASETFRHFSIPAFDDGQSPAIEPGSDIKSNKFILSDSCVLLSKLNPRIPRVWLPDFAAPHRAISSTEFLVVQPASGFSREFMYCHFTSEPFLTEFTSLVTGTSGSHQRVRPESLLAMRMRIPSLEVVGRFTVLARPILDRIATHRLASDALAAARDALLPKLLSGEIAVGQSEVVG